MQWPRMTAGIHVGKGNVQHKKQTIVVRALWPSKVWILEFQGTIWLVCPVCPTRKCLFGLCPAKTNGFELQVRQGKVQIELLEWL